MQFWQSQTTKKCWSKSQVQWSPHLHFKDTRIQILFARGAFTNLSNIYDRSLLWNQPLHGTELLEKEEEKDPKVIWKLFRKSPKKKGVYYSNSRLKAIKIKGKHSIGKQLESLVLQGKNCWCRHSYNI